MPIINRYQFKYISRISSVLTCIVLFFSISGCNKLLEVDAPRTSITSENVYADDATAAAVITGLYTSIADFTPVRAQSIGSIAITGGLSADELTLFGGSANANQALLQYYLYTLNSGSASVSSGTLWSIFYSNIYIVNIALERLEVSEKLTPAVRQQLMGEAKFLRAFYYFYLVNLYGDVPLTTTSDYRVNAVLSRNSKSVIYEQIVSDLKDAQTLLDDSYKAGDAFSPTQERLRPNKWTATALLARSYLYIEQWANAEEQAANLIDKTAIYDTVDVADVFFKGSKETIWQIQPVNAGWNTEDARTFILQPGGPTGNSSVDGNPVYLSSFLMNSFEPGDKRRASWVNQVTANGIIYYYPYKYKSATFNDPVTEYYIVFRLAEQYLIRAEARARLNKIDEAKNDLNVIRARAGLLATGVADQDALLLAINNERRIELFTEWGHRWLDLKRAGDLDVVMNEVAPAKGATWNNNWQWYPLPLYDIVQNPNLKQNTGY